MYTTELIASLLQVHMLFFHFRIFNSDNLMKKRAHILSPNFTFQIFVKRIKKNDIYNNKIMISNTGIKTFIKVKLAEF